MIRMRYVLSLVPLLAAITVVTGCSQATVESSTSQTTTPPNAITSAQPSIPNNFPGFGPGVAGTVAQIDGNTLTVDTQQEGQIKVNVSSSTAVQKTVTGSAADIQVGLFISATGSSDSNGNLVADQISIRSQSTPDRNFTPPTGAFPGTGTRQGRTGVPPTGSFDRGPGNGVFGTVVNVDGGTITLSTAQSLEVTITLASDASIQKTVDGGISDIHVGDIVTAMGSRDQSGNVDASLITTGSGGLGGFP